MEGNASRSQRGFLAELLGSERGLIDRLLRVYRFDASVYAEIESDPHAIPQAVVVVILTAVAVGLGQGSLSYALVGIAGAILAWLVVSALVWAVGMLFTGEPADITRLLRGLGFAFAWNAVQLGSSLPLIGGLVRWAAVGCWFVALVLASRQGLGLTTERAALVCLLALGLPFALALLDG